MNRESLLELFTMECDCRKRAQSGVDVIQLKNGLLAERGSLVS